MLDRAIAALAAMRDFVPTLDFVVIERRHFDLMGLDVIKTSGETPDEDVNSLHLDIIKLSVARLMLLCFALKVQGRFARRTVKQVARLVDQSLSNGHMTRDRINPKFLDSVAKYIS